MASGIYLVNDLRDAPSDRLHPTKRLRAIARATVISGGSLSALVMFAIAFAIPLALSAPRVCC